MSKTFKVRTGSAEGFFNRSLDRARKLDRGERLPEEVSITFEDTDDFLKVLSPERIRVLKEIRLGPASLAVLALNLKRDRTAVRRDVRVLASSGLVKTHEVINPGHGRQKIVEPLAARYTLTATI